MIRARGVLKEGAARGERQAHVALLVHTDDDRSGNVTYVRALELR